MGVRCSCRDDHPVVHGREPRLSGRAETCNDGCHTALDFAIITPPEARDPDEVAMLDAVAHRVLEA